MKQDYFVYETKCRRCSKLTTWVSGEAEENNAALFIVKMTEMMKYPTQRHCKKCRKATIQDFVSYGRETF